MSDSVKILHDWGDLIAVEKPAGWLTVPGRGNKEHVPVLSHVLGKQLGGKIFVIHRLDEGTSGVMLFARSADVHREFSMKFEKGEIKKTYQAVVEGEVENQIVDEPILKLPSKKNRSVVSPRGKSSQTVVRNLRRLQEAISLVEAIPLTGRSHQIRVHLAHLGHPIFGDKLYGGKMELGGEFLRSPLLHAFRLDFRLPCGDEASVESPPAWPFIKNIAGQNQT